jgi:ribosomal protein S18 acetylase RimI-like enzyme
MQAATTPEIRIENSTLADITEIYRLYRLAADYQRSKKKVVVWPEFAREMVETEIKENRQWKMLINDQMACIWVTTFSDEQIWEERNADPAVYIHRIATNPAFRGNNFVFRIVPWAIAYARQQGKNYVRLDTLDNNTRLIRHYQDAGFQFLGMFDLKNTNGLPDHYHNVPACLFQIKVD